MAGRAKENFPGGSLKYMFVFFYKSVYLNVVTVYIYIYVTLDMLLKSKLSPKKKTRLEASTSTIPSGKHINIAVEHHHVSWAN